MTDALPKGLIVKTEGTNSNIERLDGVDVADIAQLWRVYTTNTNFSDDEAGARLENFFWRIWSSSRIYQTIQGPTLAGLFARISDGSQSIRTTPVPSPPKPPASRTKGVELVTPLPPLDDSPSSPTLTSLPRANTGNRSSSGSSNEEKSSSEAPRPSLPPPILKKGRADSDDPPKTTRIIVPESDETLVTRPEPPQRRESEKNAPNQGRKKTVFVATAANSKRRPVLARRKSSRSPTSAKQSPVLTPQKGTPQEDAFHLQRPEVASAIAISSLKPTTSSGSWQDSSSLLSSRFPTDLKSTTTTAATTATTTTTTNPQKSSLSSSKPDSALPCEPQPNQPSTDSLVDKDFRTRFAEKKIRELGLSSSPSPSMMMPPPPLPQQQSVQQTSNPTSKKKAGEQQLDSTSRTQTPRSASTPVYPQSETSSTSAMASATITAPVSAAPRRDGAVNVTPSPSVSSSKSQSQLSTLIEADRRKRMAGS